MIRKTLTACCVLFFCISTLGCNPARDVAEQALDISTQRMQQQVTELANLNRQAITKRGCTDVRQAVANEDAEAAVKAVEKTATDFDRVSWLLIQHERAQSMARIAKFYVWQQESIFSVWQKELSEAKANVDAKKVATSEPSVE